MISVAESLAAFHSITRRWRLAVTLAAAILFFAGVALSIRSSGFDASAVQPAPAIILFVVLSPASLALAAVNLQMTAQAPSVWGMT